MTRTPAPALTAEEARTVARFDAAPVPPEVVAAGERQDAVARALARHLVGLHDVNGQPNYTARVAAAAAIAALPPSPAELAVQRVEALAEELDSATLPPLINDFDRGLVAGYARAAARICAALDPAGAASGETDKPCPGGVVDSGPCKLPRHHHGECRP